MMQHVAKQVMSYAVVRVVVLQRVTSLFGISLGNIYRAMQLNLPQHTQMQQERACLEQEVLHKTVQLTRYQVSFLP